MEKSDDMGLIFFRRMTVQLTLRGRDVGHAVCKAKSIQPG